MSAEQELRRTSLFDTHVSLGGRIVPFAGWEMPIQYTGILEESRAIRASAGLFDVSHMGRVDIRGRDAASFLDRVLSVNVPAGNQVGWKAGHRLYHVALMVDLASFNSQTGRVAEFSDEGRLR